MIRLFDLFKRLPHLRFPCVQTLLEKAKKDFKIDHTPCPHCGSVGDLILHGTYRRYLIFCEDKEVYESLVDIERVFCLSCKRSHALLPDLLIPYISYSLSFILCVLRKYFFKKMTVAKICKTYGIAVSTLYAWKARFSEHKGLDLGVLEKYLPSTDPYLLFPRDNHSQNLCSFFSRFGFSFLQHKGTTRSQGP